MDGILKQTLNFMSNNDLIIGACNCDVEGVDCNLCKKLMGVIRKANEDQKRTYDLYVRIQKIVNKYPYEDSKELFKADLLDLVKQAKREWKDYLTNK